MYKLPKGLPVDILGTISSSVLDCSCQYGCNITEFSKGLVRSLFFVSLKFDQPIHIAKAYICIAQDDSAQEVAHAQGRAFQMSSSDNERLMETWQEIYPELVVYKDDNFVFVREK